MIVIILNIQNRENLARAGKFVLKIKIMVCYSFDVFQNGQLIKYTSQRHEKGCEDRKFEEEQLLTTQDHSKCLRQGNTVMKHFEMMSI